MPGNSLESIIYEHVIYGASTILTGQSSIRSAAIQAEDLEEAIKQAKPLFDAEDAEEASKPAKETDTIDEAAGSYDYNVQDAHSDLLQILDVYNATVIDGRYIEELIHDPKAVAKKLGVQLSKTAAVALKEAGSGVAKNYALRFKLSKGKKIVAVAIAVVIAIRAEEKPYKIVVDSSGLVKV